MESERLLAEEEAKLKRGLLREESQARIVRVMPDIGVEPVDTRDGAARRARLFTTSSDGASQLYLRERRLDLLSFSSSCQYSS